MRIFRAAGVIVATLVAATAAFIGTAHAQVGPTFILPLDGQELDFGGAYLFEVEDYPDRVESYSWELTQGDAIFTAETAEPEFGLQPDNPAYADFGRGEATMTVRANLTQERVTDPSSITINIRTAAPVVLAPIEGETVDFINGFQATSSEVFGATRYEWEVDQTIPFKGFDIQSLTNELEMSPNFAPVYERIDDGPATVRVRAQGADGVWGPWSQVVTINAIEQPFSRLIRPDDGVFIELGTDVVITSTPIDDAVSYDWAVRYGDNVITQSNPTPEFRLSPDDPEYGLIDLGALRVDSVRATRADGFVTQPSSSSRTGTKFVVYPQYPEILTPGEGEQLTLGIDPISIISSTPYDGEGSFAYRWSVRQGSGLSQVSASIIGDFPIVELAPGDPQYDQFSEGPANIFLFLDVMGADGENFRTPGFGTRNFTFVAPDVIAPVLTVPDAISVEATGPAGATVSYVATATDAVDGDLAVDCTPASGSTFPEGDTVVSCTATDAAGNVGAGAFTVTVTPLPEPEGCPEAGTPGVDAQTLLTCLSSTDVTDVLTTARNERRIQTLVNRIDRIERLIANGQPARAGRLYCRTELLTDFWAGVIGNRPVARTAEEAAMFNLVEELFDYDQFGATLPSDVIAAAQPENFC